MNIESYSDLGELELDVLRELGSIGASNAANALSSMLGSEVRISLPEVKIMEYNEAIEWIGGPEAITAGVMVHLEGDLKGIMLSVQQIDFVNLLLDCMLGQTITDYSQLGEIALSALTEVGNIMISTFINALSGLAGIDVALTVPAVAVDMQGAILAVPMAAYGGQSDYIMAVGAQFIYEGKQVPCRLLLSPEIESLNFLMQRLGVWDG